MPSATVLTEEELKAIIGELIEGTRKTLKGLPEEDQNRIAGLIRKGFEDRSKEVIVAICPSCSAVIIHNLRDSEDEKELRRREAPIQCAGCGKTSYIQYNRNNAIALEKRDPEKEESFLVSVDEYYL